LTQPGERGGLPFRTWLRLNASVADVLEPLGYAGLPRRLVLAGHILNAFFYPALGLRWLRAQFRSRLQRTPEQRYQAVERAHEERVRGSRRIRQRRAWRAGSQYNRQ
jgi:hypothetical protein